MPARFRSRHSRAPAGDASAPAATNPGTSLEVLVDLVLAHLPGGLIGAERAASIRAAAKVIPAEVAAGFTLACRTAPPSAEASLRFCADEESGGLRLLAAGDPLVAAERWAAMRRFAAAREASPVLHRATHDVCADLALGDISNCDLGLRLGGLPEAPRRPLEVLIRALDIGLTSLRGEPLPTSVRRSMAALVRRLPATARIERAGLVGGTPADARLWITRLAPTELVELVDATRGGDEAHRLAAVLDEIVQPGAAAVSARVDVGEVVGDRIALICRVDPPGLPRQVAARWRPLLDRLVGAGLCSADKRQALAFSFGLLRARQSARWPEHLTRLADARGEGAESILGWRLAQIEIECERGGPVDATAQIVAAPRWSRH